MTSRVPCDPFGIQTPSLQIKLQMLGIATKERLDFSATKAAQLPLCSAAAHVVLVYSWRETKTSAVLGYH